MTILDNNKAVPLWRNGAFYSTATFFTSGDEQRLEGTARACAEKERFADEVFRIVRNLPPEVKNVAVE